MKKCGAKTRAGTPCVMKAGYGTDHVGEGRCKFHGGSNPIKHGRYSKIKRPRIRELLDQFDEDPNPLNLEPEVKLLRALLTDFVDRYGHFVDAMHAWHASHTEEYRKAYDQWREQMVRLTENGEWRDVEPDDLPEAPDPLDYVNKPRQTLDISAAAGLIDKVGSMVDRIERQSQQGVLTFETLDRVLEQVGVELIQTLKEEVPDAATRSRILEAFERRWSNIHLDTDRSSSARHSKAN